MKARNIITWYDEVSSKFYDETAINCSDIYDTHAMLRSKSSYFAKILIEIGVKKHDIVPVIMPRSAQLLIGIFGVLRAGAAFLPLEVKMPKKRLEFILEDIGAEYIISLSSLRHLFLDYRYNVIYLDEIELNNHAILDFDILNCINSAEDLAYVIYTSGSSGFPKGVMVRHKSLYNYLKSCERHYDIAAGSGSVLHTSVAFDMSITTLFLPLLCGKGIMILPEDENPFPLANILKQGRHDFSFIKMTPSHLRAYNELLSSEQLFGQTRILILGGESLCYEDAEKWCSADPGLICINEYGPTEVTVGCSFYKFRSNGQVGSVAIGQPFEEVQFILQHHDSLSYDEGELYLAGENLAKGYYNNLALTNSLFKLIETSAGGLHAYKTGDIIIFKDGNYFYKRRVDSQIKIKGYRIELQEIRQILIRHPEVNEAEVLNDSGGNGDEINCFIVLKDPAEATFDPKVYLSTNLPDYMMPTDVIVLDRLPLTGNGKVDRKHLLGLLQSRRGNNASISQEVISAVPELESKVLSVFKSVLGRCELLENENFFEMGGDSIKTIQVVSRLNKVDINIEISDLFQFPTVQGLVDMITARQSARPGYDRLKLENLARLSPIQKWFFSLDLAENNNFILSQMVDFKFDIKHDKLLSLLKILIQSTDSFSSYFSKGLHNDFEVTVRDINESSIKADRCSVPLEEIDSYIEQYSQCIDIISGPLVVVLTFDLLPKKLFLACHHLVMDPISIAMFLDTLATLFSEVNEGSLLRILPFNSYYKWAETLYAKAHTPEILAEFPYWYTVLSCFEGVKNPVKRSDQSEYYQASCIDLNPEAYSILKDYSISIGLGMEKLLIALLLRAMGQCFDYHQVGLMIESTGRDYENNYHNQGVFLSQIMGWMTIRYPVMFSISEGQSFDSLALSVDRVLSMVPNKGLGYGLLRYLVSDKTVISLAQLREPGILFNYLGEILEPEKTAEWQVSTEQPTLESAQKIQCVSTIEINCQVRDGSLNIDYLFDAANISEGHAILLVDTYRSTILGLINQLSEVSCSSPHVLPVSAAQEGILYHCMANPSSGVYHTQTVYVIEGNIEPLVMGKAWQFLMSVYPALRASFIWDVSHQPGQIIANDLEACFSVLSYEGISEIDQKMRLEEFLAQDSKVLFCLDSPPLWRVAIIKLSAQKYWMLWSCHHVIIDGWSSDLVLKNLSKVYDQLSMGHLPDVPRDNYEQYLKTFSSNSELLAIDYWKHYLLRVDFSTQLSATMPSQEASSRDIFRFSAEQIFSLGTDVVIKLRTALKDQNITMSTLIQYAWAKVLSFYCQQDTVVFGAVVSGRHCEIENVEDVVGCLINIVPIIVAVGDIKNCADLLSHQINFMASLKHSQVSLAKILSLKQKITLFDTIMIFQAQKASDSHDDLRGLQISQLTCNENTEYAITLGVNFVENQLHFKLRYRPAQFSEEQIQGISSYLSSIIVYIAHSSDLAGGPSLWANNAYSNKWLQWNNRELLIPKDLSLKSLVMEQMRARAVQVAIIDEKKTYTYQQLHEDSQALVLALSGIGLKKGDSLAVGLPRSYEVVVVIIALLKMGIVYVPINAHYPLTRIRYIIENSQCKKLLLLDVSDAIPELNGLIHYYSDLINARGNFSNVTLAHDEQPFDGLCVFYTSGSTGNPKGVSISNKSMLNRVMWAIKDLAITTNDKLLHHCEPTFDIGLGEVLFPLLGGATLVIMPAVPKDSYSVVNFIRYTGVTVIHILPSFLEKLLEEPKFLINDSVRLIACGGELVTQKLCARVLQRRKIALHILYGPTEAAISVTCLHVHQQRAVAPNSIGFPIDNCQVFIADSILNPLPFGVTGEIYIMGPCVALGYINNSDETKLRFYQLRQFPGKAIYQTGDLGRYLSDGQIQFVGRRDNQVKLRGHRIELGEIESAIITHPLVNSVRVLLKKEGEQDKLLAFVVPTALEVLSINHERLINDIKESLSLKLPSYFLPSHILLLHDLPLTPNDKIDDQVLLNMPLPLCRDKVSTAAINLSPIEESIIKIAEKVLGTIGLNIFDNFFAVGGCSLVAMTFCRALRELGYDNISINLLYQHPRLKDLCSRLETPDLRIDYRRALVHVTPMNVGKPLLCLIHPVSGLIEDYKALASCNINYDVYAIANPGFAENVLFTSLEEMATAYISILEHIPCHENIRIGGWSFGGVVAYEMARQMRERSFRVDSVILIDSYPPSHIDFKIGVDSILSQASGLQGQQVDLLRQEMEANKSLLMSYVPQPLDVKMAFLKADAIDFTGGSNAATPWDGLVSQVNVYPLSARHLQLFAANNVGELVLAVNSIDI